MAGARRRGIEADTGMRDEEAARRVIHQAITARTFPSAAVDVGGSAYNSSADSGGSGPALGVIVAFVSWRD